MESSFTLAQVRAVRLGAVKLAGALCLVPLLSTLLWADSGLAQSNNASGAPSSDGAASARFNPAPPAVRRPNLELGRQGGAVAELQGVLKLLGFYRGDVTGSYDEATSLAVARFQAAAKLPQTGRVATNTWNALFPLDTASPAIATAPRPTAPTPAPQPPAPQPTPAVPATTSQPAAPKPAAPRPVTPKPAASKPAAPKPETKPNPYPTLKLGQKGNAVARLQRQLSKKGFLDGASDGAFGPMTEEAVKAAQEALGLEVDGVVGPATWRALLK